MSNQNQFEITQKIHQELDKLAKTTGIKIEVESTYGWIIEPDGVFNSQYNDFQDAKALIAIEPPQIKQILIAFEEKLGENPEYKKRQIQKNILEEGKEKDGTDFEVLMYKMAYKNSSDLLKLTPQTQSEALCQKWLDGLNPLFDSNPTQVLTELLEVLQNIK